MNKAKDVWSAWPEKDMPKDAHHLRVRRNEIVKEYRDLGRELERLAQEARDTIEPVYDWQVTVSEVSERDVRRANGGLKIGQEIVTINRHLTNMADYDAILDTYGTLSNRPEEHVYSMGYYRIGTILLHTWGGYRLLKEGTEVTDENWELLKSGITLENWL